VNINKGLLIPHLPVSSLDLSHASNVVLFYCKHSFHEECLPTLDITDVSTGYSFFFFWYVVSRLIIVSELLIIS
jgi:hypothetical protein